MASLVAVAPAGVVVGGRGEEGEEGREREGLGALTNFICLLGPAILKGNETKYASRVTENCFKVTLCCICYSKKKKIASKLVYLELEKQSTDKLTKNDIVKYFFNEKG